MYALYNKTELEVLWAISGIPHSKENMQNKSPVAPLNSPLAKVIYL